MKMKRMIAFMFLIMTVFLGKLEVSAEGIWTDVIWNTTGETTSSGYEYTYKYWTGGGWMYCGNGMKEPPKLVDITYNATYDYEEAYKMLEYVNEIRREAGVPELIMKDELMDVAMRRAAECVKYFGHIRPNGMTDARTLSFLINGENLAWGYNSSKGATQGLKNSSGHYETMIDPMYKYVGFGNVGGVWVQVFSVENLYYIDGFDFRHPENNRPVEWDKMTCGKRKNYTEKFTVKVNMELYSKLVIDLVSESYNQGDEIKPLVRLRYMSRNNSFNATVPLEHCNISFSNDKVQVTENGIRCVKPGKTKITISMKDAPEWKASQEIEICAKDGSDATPEETTDKQSERITKAKKVKAVINKVTNKKGKKIVVDIKKAKGYKYQVKVSTSKKFEKDVAAYKTSKEKYIIKKLKKGKQYYVKVRTYKVIDGKKYYGKWSKIKSVKIKK